MLTKTTTAKPNRKAPHPIDKHVGSRVRMRRMMLGISQSTLGDALGVSFQQVQKNEIGANRIGSSRLQEIARVLQVQVGWFFEGLSDEVVGATDALLPEYCSPALVAEFMATTDGLKLVKAYMALREPLRRGLVALVVKMADHDDRGT